MKFRFACTLAVLALALVATGAAQAASPTSTLSGTVVSSSDTSLVIKTDAGLERTFAVDAESRLPAGLTPGTRVTVSYHIMDGGSLHASNVTLGGDTPSATRTTPSDTRPMDTDTRAAEATTADTLPATASNESLLLLAGLLALGGGLVLRRSLSHS